MSVKRISDFDLLTPLAGTEQFEIETASGQSKRATAQDIANLAPVEEAPNDGQSYVRKSKGWSVSAGGGGGGSVPIPAYAVNLCAQLEPDAIEPLQTDAFVYAVAAGVTKFVTVSWQTQINGAGRSEVRDPRSPMALRNTSLNGSGAGSCAIIVDPSLGTYADPWTTYYTRKLEIDQLDVKTINVTGSSQHIPFLPGAYGAIITQATVFDLAWMILRIAGTWGPNLTNEISDSATQRVGNGLSLAVSKRVAGEIESSATGSGSGSVSYVLVPSTWSTVPDPVSESYLFRDDFMGATLDPTVWTIASSTAGNVAIDPKYQWCKLFGTNSWSGNALYRSASVARAEGRSMVVDVFAPRDASNGIGCVGWALGGSIAGYSNNNFAHAVNFAGGGGILNVYEDGNLRSTVGSGWTAGCIYRVRIVMHAGGSATYSIQGGSQYPPIGGATWTDITPAGSASSNNTVYPGAAAYGGSGYISDFRVY